MKRFLDKTKYFFLGVIATAVIVVGIPVYGATVQNISGSDTVSDFPSLFNQTVNNLNADKLDIASSTDDLSEGNTNLYYTAARDTAQFVSDLAGTTSVSSITNLPNFVGASSIVTVGTLTSGATGAGFTVDLDASSFTCTNCVDISANTNLAAGTNITLVGDTLNVDDAFLVNNADDVTTGSLTATHYNASDANATSTFQGVFYALKNIISGGSISSGNGTATTTVSSAGITFSDGSVQTTAVDASDTASTNAFGDGSDGDVTISAHATATADKFFDDFTVDAGVTYCTCGYRIFVKGTLTNNGTIHNNGQAASDGTAGVADGVNFTSSTVGTGGSAGTAGASGTLDGPAASLAGVDGVKRDENTEGSGNTTGNSGSNGTSKNPSLGSSGAAGSDGGDGDYNGGTITGSGGTGGTAGTATSENALLRRATSSPATLTEISNLIFGNLTAGNTDSQEPTKLQWFVAGATSGTTTSPSATSGSSGSGGIALQGAAGTDRSGVSGGTGGTGGAGGNLHIAAKTLDNQGTISVNGGPGGDAGNSDVANDGSGGVVCVGGSSGGPGGPGGVAMIIYEILSNFGTVTATGGTGGTGGTKAVDSGSCNVSSLTEDGASGNNGTAGKIYRVDIN